MAARVGVIVILLVTSVCVVLPTSVGVAAQLFCMLVTHAGGSKVMYSRSLSELINVTFAAVTGSNQGRMTAQQAEKMNGELIMYATDSVSG
jgi:hypothetical protein